jgi:NitT/TauT family transport system permease protein
VVDVNSQSDTSQPSPFSRALDTGDGAREPIDDGRRSRITPMRRRAAFRLNGSRLLLIVVIIVLWQVISDVGHLSLYMSSPTAVLSKLISWYNSGVLGTAVGVTIEEAVIGYVIGSIAGAVVGFVLGRIEFVGKLLDPIVLALYAVPKIALAPLFVLWLGIGIVTKISVAALLVFFLVFYNTYAGTKQIDERLCDQARLMGAGRWDVMSKLVMPQAAAWCFVGLRIALPYSLTGAVVGEFISSTEGIGYEINNATATFDTAGVFAGLVLLTVIALILNMVLDVVEKRMSRWSPESLRADEERAMT